MRIVVDASVFIAAGRDAEPEHQSAREALDRIVLSSIRVYCPVLVLPECSGAIVRLTNTPEVAARAIARIEQFPRLMLVPLDQSLGEIASGIAVRCRLRGADACYVALAHVQKIALLTLDREMLQRGAAVVRTVTPAQWLAANPSKAQE